MELGSVLFFLPCWSQKNTVFWEFFYHYFSIVLFLNVVSNNTKPKTTIRKRFKISFHCVFWIYVFQIRLQGIPLFKAVAATVADIFVYNTTLFQKMPNISVKTIVKGFLCYRLYMSRWLKHFIFSCNTIPKQWLVYVSKLFDNKFSCFRLQLIHTFTDWCVPINISGYSPVLVYIWPIVRNICILLKLNPPTIYISFF